MKFTHLHVHSHYSLLDGLPKIDGLIDRAKELGMDSLAITDHGALYGIVEFYQKAKAKGVKPIIGIEAYVAPRTQLDKQPRVDDKNFHLILLVKNKTGYQNLVWLTTKAWLDGFYYKPRVDKELLRAHAEGLIACSACIAGEIPRAIMAGDPQKARNLALDYQKIFGAGNFFLELQHHANLPEQAKVNSELIKIGKKYNIPLVATNDVHYLMPEQAQAQDILMLVNTNTDIDDPERLSMKDNDFSLRSPEQFAKDFSHIPEALSNTQKIAEQCDFDFELGKYQLPHFKVPAGQTPEGLLKELAYKGISKRYPGQTNKEVLDRLEYELDVINKTGFASYFLIVQDFVNWAKDQGIGVGPGRGSAAGSIVAYLLNITEINPLKYDLLFERFLNPERISMPDIDLDFADNRRDEVIAYVRQKYGNDHVAQIVTFGTMAARAAIRDTGRAMGIAYQLCDQTAKTVPFGSTLEQALQESQEFKQLYDSDDQVKKLVDTAMILEGVARHASTHAAGVVITKDPLNKIVPLQRPTQDKENGGSVSQFEMHAIEDLGLLKMDFLGLKTLTQIQNTVNIIKNTKNEIIDVATLPLDDSKTYKLLQEARTTGVFQLESGGMKRNLKDLKPTVFEDIIAMVALYRPGPMDLIPDFISRKHGQKKIEYVHPLLEPILKNTYGIIVYQEQVMAVASKLAGFTLPEADTLRKAMGKKIKKLMDEQREKLIQGMTRNNIPGATAEKIWEFIEPFAQYGFNKSHATCYALLGYQTAYLKARYPTEFMAALMNSESNDIERVAFLVDECRQMDIEVLPPHINESLGTFTVINPHTLSPKNIAAASDTVKGGGVKDGAIRFGLKAVKNVGSNVVDAIVKERKQNGPFKTIAEIIERVKDKDLNKKSLESLIKCGALDDIGERGQFLANLEALLNYAREVQRPKTNGQASLFSSAGADTKNLLPPLKLQEAPAAGKKEKLDWEKELLGLYVSEHPAQEYEKVILQRAFLPSKLSREMVGKQVKVGGVISHIHKIITKAGKPMLFVGLEDQKAKLEILVFPKTLERTPTFWQEGKVIIASGRLDDKEGNFKLLMEDAQELNQNHLQSYR